jgi:hypothetical protein
MTKRLTVGSLKRIIAEEQSKLQEQTPFGGVTKTQKMARRGRPSAGRVRRAGPDTPSAVDTSPAGAVKDALAAHAATKKSLDAFNPKWHRMVCRTAQGQEMSDLVIELEKALKDVGDYLSMEVSMDVPAAPNVKIPYKDAKDDIMLPQAFDESKLREAIAKEIRFVMESGLAEAPFTRSASRAQRAAQSRAAKMGFRGRGRTRPASTATAAPARKDGASPNVTKMMLLISDMITLYDTFSPKIRRTMCLGKAGKDLVFNLQSLYDLLGKL